MPAESTGACATCRGWLWASAPRPSLEPDLHGVGNVDEGKARAAESSRLRRGFLFAALTVAYVLVLPPAVVAALWLLGYSVPGKPPANSLLLCLMVMVASGVALAILRHVPLAGRSWAREVMLLAVFAMLALAFAACT